MAENASKENPGECKESYGSCGAQHFECPAGHGTCTRDAPHDGSHLCGACQSMF